MSLELDTADNANDITDAYANNANNIDHFFFDKKKCQEDDLETKISSVTSPHFCAMQSCRLPDQNVLSSKRFGVGAEMDVTVKFGGNDTQISAGGRVQVSNDKGEYAEIEARRNSKGSEVSFKAGTEGSNRKERD